MICFAKKEVMEFKKSSEVSTWGGGQTCPHDGIQHEGGGERRNQPGSSTIQQEPLEWSPLRERSVQNFVFVFV